jgi:hypothetical protein
MRRHCTISSRQHGSNGSLDAGLAAVIVATICTAVVGLSIVFCLQASATSLPGGTAVLSDAGRITSNPSFKGDRLKSARAKVESDVNVTRSSATNRGTKIPVGCERAFSAFAKLSHANVAVRCVTAINPPSKFG